MPVRVTLTARTTADCTEAVGLIDGIKAEAVLADKAYDVDFILEKIHQSGAQAVIPPKKNRKDQRLYDQDLYS